MIEEIKEIIKKAAGVAGDFSVFFSEQSDKFGNYCSNAPFLLAKKLKKPPLEIAKEIAEKIKTADKGKLFLKVEAAAPGYVNFWLSSEALVKELEKILKSKKLLNSSTPQLINLEFISANPTGPLTMANGRGGFLGDVLANILEAVGHKVTREYFINDAGNQIQILGESILAALGRAPSKEEHYKGDYIKKRAQEIAKKMAGEKNLEEIGWQAAIKFIKNIKNSVQEADIKFDVWYSEFDNLRGKKGLINKLLKLLEKKNLIAEKEGAKWLKSSEISDEKDRVLVKSNGQPTYFLADLAYHYDKFVKRKFDLAIDIWGADHHGYVARLKSGVKALGIDPERLKIIITQLVRLVEGGKEVKMSKRKGEFVTLDELVKEVGNKDAVRFFFLTHVPETHMDFDLALAKERSQKNPVYYIQYAYVRALHILQKTKGIKYQVSSIKNLKNESETNLLSGLVKLPYMIRQTAEDYNVSRLARYAMELARAFHNFYEKERVIDEKGKIDEGRLALVAAVKNIFERLFKILGIDTPKKM